MLQPMNTALQLHTHPTAQAPTRMIRGSSNSTSNAYPRLDSLSILQSIPHSLSSSSSTVIHNNTTATPFHLAQLLNAHSATDGEGSSEVTGGSAQRHLSYAAAAGSTAAAAEAPAAAAAAALHAEACRLQHVRAALQMHLQQSTLYDAAIVLEAVAGVMLLSREAVLLHCRLGEHAAALSVLALDLEDVEGAVFYCKVHAGQQGYLQLLDLFLRCGWLPWGWRGGGVRAVHSFLLSEICQRNRS